MTEILAIILVLFAAVLGSFGQFFFKLGAGKLSLRIKQLITNYFILLGFILYGFSVILFVFALTKGELSVLYPLVATSYIWTALLAQKYLKENMNFYKWLGVALIIAGVVLIV